MLKNFDLIQRKRDNIDQNYTNTKLIIILIDFPL